MLKFSYIKRIKYWIVTDKQAKPDFTFLYLDFVKFGFSF